MGPEVVLGAKWRPKAEKTSRFDFTTPSLYRRSVGTFRLSPFKSYLSVFIWLEIRHWGSKIWGFRDFDPEM
jgi:hypothetical protein